MLWLLCGVAMAGPKGELVFARSDINSQSYTEAIERLERIRGSGDDRLRADIELALVQALLGYTGQRWLEQEYPTAEPVKAAEALLRARELGADPEKRYVEGVVGALFMTVSHAEPTDPEALRCAELVVRVAPGEHTSHMLLAQIQQLRGDHAGALVSFQQAIELYEKPSTRHDPSIYIAYWSAATILRIQDAPDLPASLALLDRGYATMEAHRTSSGGGADWDAALARLRTSRIDVLAATKRELAAEIALRPNEPVLRLSLASMLEADDPDAAQAEYERVIAIDGSSMMAHYNLAALFVNRAVTAQRAANETESWTEAQTHVAEQRKWLAKARPHLEKAYALEPSRDIARALFNVVVGLEDMEAAAHWKAEAAKP